MEARLRSVTENLMALSVDDTLHMAGHYNANGKQTDQTIKSSKQKLHNDCFVCSIMFVFRICLMTYENYDFPSFNRRLFRFSRSRTTDQ